MKTVDNEKCPCGSGKPSRFCCSRAKRNKSSTVRDDAPLAKVLAFPIERTKVGRKKPNYIEGIDEGDITIAYRLIDIAADRIEAGEHPVIDEACEAFFDIKKNMSAVMLHVMLLLDQTHDADEDGLLFEACAALLQEGLTRLRFAVEKGRVWAAAESERVQMRIADEVLTNDHSQYVWMAVLQALQESKLDILPEVRAATARLAEDESSEHYQVDSSTDFDQVFEELLLESDEKDPYELYDFLVANTEIFPVDYQLRLVSFLVSSPNPLARDVAGLCLLHPDAEVRKSVPRLYLSEGRLNSVSPDTLRRMICIRNWLPEDERPLVDQLIKKIRLTGIEASAPQTAQLVRVVATPFDGAGGHGLCGAFRVKRRYLIFGMYVKQEYGIRDVWVNAGLTKREVDRSFTSIYPGDIAHDVPASYVQNIGSYFLWVGTQQNHIPTIAMLRIAELMGFTAWLPSADALHTQLKQVESDRKSRARRGRPKTATVLRRTDGWLEEPFAETWFEEDNVVLRVVPKEMMDDASVDPDLFDEASRIVLEEVLEPRRSFWAEKLKWMAAWQGASDRIDQPSWQDFLTVADEIEGGRSLADIPLMVGISEVSVATAQFADEDII